ncbi:hypothetical protein LTR78_009682 [Recurvomyces mirabilis]|uniref:Uncharacterized protein n=1 Tax=Recurvomyces mirabilis TaxID=574656 RepID=A0AAE0TTB5_9PEZI|nr:hypothetical protein LTR78_009682 [Recurvomyces mirabilis]KAK5150277.1 hypothetical protein LTS14_010253 [Recurvomyces mirabilis]
MIPVVLGQRDPKRALVTVHIRQLGVPDRRAGGVYEDELRAHSKLISRRLDEDIAAGFIKADDMDKNVFLKGISHGPAAMICEEIDVLYKRKKHDKNGDFKLKINAYHLPLAHGVALWTAVLAMEIYDPPQHDHMERQLRWNIGHNKISPSEMLAIARGAYQYREVYKLWGVLVHQVAYDVLYDKYTIKEGNALRAAAIEARDMPELLVEMSARYVHLRDIKEHREQETERRAARN